MHGNDTTPPPLAIESPPHNWVAWELYLDSCIHAQGFPNKTLNMFTSEFISYAEAMMLRKHGFTSSLHDLSPFNQIEIMSRLWREETSRVYTRDMIYIYISYPSALQETPRNVQHLILPFL